MTFGFRNPPFNDSDWGGGRPAKDVRWKFGVPPPANANFAWVQHFIHHLAPNGIAGFVLILTAEIDLAQIVRGKYGFDVVGHYARPDIFQLQVDERPKNAVRIADDKPTST